MERRSRKVSEVINGVTNSVVFVSYLGNRPCESRETSSDYQEWGRDGLTKVYLPAGCWFANAKASKLRPSVEDHFSNICEFYIFF